uniref:NMDA receptor-regulated protein n=1 Tax=Rhizophora mucronata TaxID=61149 RepID=A0A2P2MTN2_RHIMU
MPIYQQFLMLSCAIPQELCQVSHIPLIMRSYKEAFLHAHIVHCLEDSHPLVSLHMHPEFQQLLRHSKIFAESSDIHITF